ncbi:hypothetical protein YC2023_064267 [Brassica napus]
MRELCLPLCSGKFGNKMGKKSNRLDTTTTYTGDWPEIVVLRNLTRALLSV